MRFVYFPSILILLVLNSCGERGKMNSQDSAALFEQVYAEIYPDNSPYGIAHTDMLRVVQPLAFPDWIDVDSTRNYKVEMTSEKTALLFPKGFEIPETVQVFAFAKQELDSSTDGIWYLMEVESESGIGNRDVWMVLYNDTAGPIAAHCFATRGVGYGRAKIDSVNSFREVFVDETNKTMVTTKNVTIENGKFVVRNESTKTFAASPDEKTASQEYIAEFFK